ncbi:hypothetical protein ACQKP0_02955 [Heyndrickxia sp. NPDC080065]|uniref:hypothetical protein n=1 Tax=Heyndrickxia sp. NPDC080065 TaxID=3390568 RepID=UPI003D0230B3
MDQIETLKLELSRLKETNVKLYQNNIEPTIKKKVQEFLQTFEDYFRERGFVVKKKDHSVKAAYSSLEFEAFSNDGDDIFIMKEREQIASISVKHKRPNQLAAYTFENALEQLKWEIDKEKSLTTYLENPVFYYTGSDFGRQYESPETVLDSIFHV